jgi:hypothetical protein
MSWAAHQFEYYALQGHLPKRWVGQISFLAIVAGDQSCDLVGKVWTYGFDLGGRHYGPEQPSLWHRGWPGLGVTHTLLWAFVAAGLVYVCTRSRPWTLGILLGVAIHAMTDITDSVGTMLAFPFSSTNFSVGAWAYAATAEGKLLDAAAYYSSWGFLADTIWLILALTAWRCLTREAWRRDVVGADPRAWAWLGRWMPERALVTLYRAWFIYAVTRLVAWTAWAHVLNDFEWDLRWGGPSWIPKAVLSHPDPTAAVVAVLCSAVVVYVAVSQLLRAPVGWWRNERAAATASTAPPARRRRQRDR